MSKATVENSNWNKIYDYRESNLGIILTKYRSKEPIVVIPSEIDNKPVIAIDTETFKKKKITSVSIPSTVRVIGINAFLCCEELETLQIDNKEIEIKRGAFYDCKKLADENGFIIVNNILFRYIGTEEEVYVPGHVRVISANAFEFNKTLKSITIPESVERVEINTFYGCRKLEKINISLEHTRLDPSAIDNCKKLADKDKHVIIDHVYFKYLGDKSHVVIPTGVTTIQTYAFSWNSGIISIEVPEGVTTLNSTAFYLTNLEKVVLPTSISNIHPYAFIDCKKLTLYVVEGSYSETYAKDHNIPYKTL